MNSRLLIVLILLFLSSIAPGRPAEGKPREKERPPLTSIVPPMLADARTDPFACTSAIPPMDALTDAEAQRNSLAVSTPPMLTLASSVSHEPETVRLPPILALASNFWALTPRA